MEKKGYKRTIQKSYIWDICMVLCIMMIFPVNISLLFLKNEQAEKAADERSVLNSELEWQVLHELAAVIPVEYEKEALKAQAIILRTNLLAEKEDAMETETTEFPLLYVYKNKWGSAYETNCKKIFEAVKETKGMYIEENGKLVRTSFFRLSNGKTRKAEECLGKRFSLFSSKECQKDLLCEQFLQKSKFSGERFAEKLSTVIGKQTPYEDLKELDITYEYDSAGYVLSVQFGETTLGGEIFRKEFSLPSSDFSILFDEKNVWIETKGIGSGIGFCQYGANELAKEGKDFIDLLNYFFTNIAISKTE